MKGLVKTAENSGVGDRKRSEQSAAKRDQPDFIAVPQRTDRVHHQTPLVVGFGDPRVQDSDAQIETIQNRVATDQDPQQHEPDHRQQVVVDHGSCSIIDPP